MKKIKYIYILSQRYSGSTLLSFLLGTHPNISTIGERRKFYIKSITPNLNDKTKCSCGAFFQNCDHWNAIKKGLLERVDIDSINTNFTEFQILKNRYANWLACKSFEFCLVNGFPKMLIPFSSKITKLNNYNRILVEEILKIDKKSIFLDSSKSINQVLFLSQIKELDLSVIWLTRDPRAQVNSAIKYNDWTIEEATENWKKEMIHNEKILKKLKIKHTVLHYEALCKNPKQEINDLLKFTGLKASPFSLNFREKTQHIMGNYSMRLGADDKIVERQEWRESLSEVEIKYIEDITIEYSQFHCEI